MTALTYTRKDSRMTFNRNPGPGESNFTGEASTLFGPAGVTAKFTLTVEETGNTREFFFVTANYDEDGDMTDCIYSTRREYKGAAPVLTFRVFND